MQMRTSSWSGQVVGVESSGVGKELLKTFHWSLKSSQLGGGDGEEEKGKVLMASK
jgi:hypothetical protein